MLMKDRSMKYTSLTLAGLMRIRDELSYYNGHMVIDDLGAEKSLWSRVSTVTVLATIVHTHYVRKITQRGVLEVLDFQGSASLNVQPVLMNSLVHDDDWIAVVRDKVLRYYHLIRPIDPQDYMPAVKIDWGMDIDSVKEPKRKGKLWYHLVLMGLTQWSYGRVKEHIPMLLKGCAALDGRAEVKTQDYNLLIKLLKPMQLERYVLTSFGFETGRNFLNNVYCVLVELASHGEPTINTICEDYKVNPSTVERLIATMPDWCWVKANSPKHVVATEQAHKILKLVGVNQKW